MSADDERRAAVERHRDQLEALAANGNTELAKDAAKVLAELDDGEGGDG